MSGKNRAFTLIGEQDVPDEAPTAPTNTAALTKLNTEMLMLALRALSNRAMTAVTNLFTIGLVVSAWMLWSRVLDNPTDRQLAALGGYAVFCIAVDVVRRRSTIFIERARRSQ